MLIAVVISDGQLASQFRITHSAAQVLHLASSVYQKGEGRIFEIRNFF